MPQGSQSVSDNPGAVVRAALNTELAALYGLSSGSSAPSVTCAYMLWWDTTANLIKIRDAANANWVAIGSVDQTNKIWMQPGFGGNASIASGATVDLASVNAGTVTVTGTTTITSFGSSMKTGQVKIIDTPSGLTLTYNATSMITPGAKALVMAAGDSAFVQCVGSGNYRVSMLTKAVATREYLVAARSYYVDVTNGNDSNTGLAAGAGNAWKTFAKAVAWILSNIDLGGQTVTVNVADGTYSTGIVISGAFTGAGLVQFIGNTSTPGNCLISTTSANPVTGSGGAQFTIDGMKLVTTTSGNAIQSSGAGTNITTGGHMQFGACASAQGWAFQSGTITFGGAYTINGNAQMHWGAVSGGQIVASGVTVTLSGTPAFSIAFAVAQTGAEIEATSNVFSGSATGARYSATGNGVIDTNGGSGTYLPGNSAGATSTGGQYV